MHRVMQAMAKAGAAATFDEWMKRQSDLVQVGVWVCGRPDLITSSPTPS